MKKIILTLVIVCVVVVLAMVVVIYSGAYNIGTSNHDNALVNRVLDTGMTRSVRHHAKGIQAPVLNNPAKVQEGFEHFDQMCVECHGAPGVPVGEIAQGLWPHAPNLARTVPTWTPSQLFWITKNGIKFSAMPAWGPSHDDGEIWAMVAFMETLPQLSPAQYREMEQKFKGQEHGVSEKPQFSGAQ